MSTDWPSFAVVMVTSARNGDGVPHFACDMLLAPERFQLPLYAALAISPICLLMSTSLYDRSIGKEHILDVSHQYLESHY